MKHKPQIIVLDFGAQYSQLIARRIRDMKIYCQIMPYFTDISVLQKAINDPDTPLKGIVLSGGPSSVYAENAPHIDAELFDLGVPILGICYGMQIMAYRLGGQVIAGEHKEYGHADLHIDLPLLLFEGLPPSIPVWMSHGDRIDEVPPGFQAIAYTDNTPIAAMADKNRNIYGVQFHPEVTHTPNGNDILRNFALEICKCQTNWSMETFVQDAMEEIQNIVGTGHVLCGVSGGVDSTVLAKLLTEALGSQVTCMYVDNGVMRKDETKEVINNFTSIGVEIKAVDASKRFLTKLAGIEEPEKKRRIIGKEFIDVFFSEAGAFDFLAQGTLYPDVIESVSVAGPSATIKTHHNRAPEVLELIKEGKVIEPLKELFKDEVRKIGAVMGIPEHILWRYPFPGPGLAIRVLGEVTEERLRVLRDADRIVRDELERAEMEHYIWQAFAVLLPVRSVGVMGDERTYENVIAVRAVSSIDGMTADWSKVPYDVLGKISNRIINEVRGVNRVVYDISSKPPATIEWE